MPYQVKFEVPSRLNSEGGKNKIMIAIKEAVQYNEDENGPTAIILANTIKRAKELEAIIKDLLGITAAIAIEEVAK